MCYYNGQKVTRIEFIRLKNLEKIIAKYSFLNKYLLIGFDYGKSAVLKKIEGEEYFFDIAKLPEKATYNGLQRKLKCFLKGKFVKK